MMFEDGKRIIEDSVHWIKTFRVESKYDASAMAYLINNRECDSTEKNLEIGESGKSFISRRKGGKMTERFR